MPHTFAAHLCTGYFNAAFITDLALKTQTLILAAVAFPVLLRPENPLAEKAVALRLEGTVIDRFRLLNLTVRPLADLLGRCKSDFN